MTNLKKWKLLSSTDVSPSPWFPIEKRSYELPNGKVIDDFTVTTLADVAMIVPITKDQKIVVVRQYKPGVDEIFIQFPAGRKEPSHQDLLDTAHHELLEETGIQAPKESFHQFAKISGFSTKATEVVFCFLVQHVEINQVQKLDETEAIEVLQFSTEEIDKMIMNGEIWCGQTIATWELAKKHFPEVFVRMS